MKRCKWAFVVAGCLALTVLACSGSDSGPEGPVTDGDTSQENDSESVLDGDSEAAIDGDLSEGEAEESEGLAPCDEASKIRVLRFVAKAVDENGQALPGAKAIFCLYATGTVPSCLNPATADNDGVIVANVPEGKQCVESAAVRILGPPSGPARIIPSCPVALTNGGVVNLGVPMKLTKIPAVIRDELGEDGGAVHVITAPDNSVLSVVPDKLWLIDYAYTDLAQMIWDSATAGRPCFMNENDSFVSLVAVYPEIATKSKGGAHLRVPNTTHLANGTLLDVYGVGGAETELFNKTAVDEGALVKIGTALVSDDETTIETQGDGLPFLTWIGFKLPTTSR